MVIAEKYGDIIGTII